MKNVTIHTGKLEIIEQLRNSASDNPRYLCKIDGWTCRTIPDSDYAYGLTNLNGKKVQAAIGTHYGTTQIDWIKTVE